MSTTKDKLEFVYVMARHSDATLSDCQHLMRYATTHHRLAEHHCNGDCLYEHSVDDVCQRQVVIEHCIEIICATFDAGVKFSGDPRGATVKIKVKDGFCNDWGNQGICVPV